MTFRWNRAGAHAPALSLIAVAAVLCLSRSAAAQTAAEAAGSAASAPTDLSRVFVPGKRLIDVGPLPGLAITIDQIPANVQSATKEQIKNSRALNIADYMNTQMQGISVNDYGGNPFQINVNYHGFTASPEVGTPQGLSVFFDGVRVNEPFGDVVNWDLIPTNAIERFDLFPGSNPLFGLNTLGGAISVRTKNGFTAPGLEASVMGGSWGRTQVQLSGGKNNGTVAGFGALTVFDENGWRDNSPSRVNQFYGRTDLAMERGTLGLSLLAATNSLVGNGLLPVELVRQRPETVFTSPDQSKNRLVQLTLSGDRDLTDKVNVGFRAYHRKSDRSGLNGDIYEGFQDLDANNAPHNICLNPNDCTPGAPRNGAYGGSGVIGGTPIGLLTSMSLSQTTDGASVQANWNLARHKFMVGASIDRSRASYAMSQRLGLIDATHRVYADATGIDPDYYAGSHDVPGSNFHGAETTKSVYTSETWSPRDNLHLTAAARYNATTTDSFISQRASSAQRDLGDLYTDTPGLAEALAITAGTQEGFSYRSFNPEIGINWLPQPDLNLYVNLSRGARVPSVVELGCAFDKTPVNIGVGTQAPVYVARSLTGPGCALPTALSGDPYLPQIRSTSGEIGGRGKIVDTWAWDVSLFRTDLTDDIYFVGVGDGKSFFDTVGKTRREGLELGFSGSVGPLDTRLSYSYTRATFESQFYLVSQYNSSADFNQNSQSVTNGANVYGLNTLPSPTATANGGRGTYLMTRVDPGARMPGIPLHSLSGTVDWHATSDLKVGLTAVVRSSSYVRGNESNAHKPAGTDQQTGLYYCNNGPGQCGGGLQQQPVVAGRPFVDSGSVAGYATFNLDADYRISRRFSGFLKITNLFDTRYATAGRLGINPFSPSSGGAAVGASGWNYNSSQWQNTTYTGPAAPRGFFIGLNYELGEK